MTDISDAPRPCAVASCSEPRTGGGQFCLRHGPTRRAATSKAPTRRAPRAGAPRVCPHCRAEGQVIGRLVKQKKGVSGGKLTGAVLTAGLSILGTGLSRKQQVTELHCTSCNMTWHVE